MSLTAAPSTLSHLECTICGERHDDRVPQNVCTACGRVLAARYDPNTGTGLEHPELRGGSSPGGIS